jgi:mitochondrial fission protein ELM1
VPHFAGGVGRAIYNTVAQIYLADPGELFDLPLGGHGFLARGAGETAVMLLDCARMAPVWPLAAAQRRRRQWLEAAAAAVPGLRGQLDPVWHARDTEYVPQRSKLLHYAAGHLQPWQPARQRYAYQRHPFAQVWLDLERAAEAAGYQVFRATQPSAQYAAFVRQVRLAPARAPGGTLHPRGWLAAGLPGVREVLRVTGARTLLLYGFGLEPETPAALGGQLGRTGLAITPYDRAYSPPLAGAGAAYDGVVGGPGLAGVPAEDVPWVLEEMFAQARQWVCLLVGPPARGQRAAQGARTVTWWHTQVAAVSARHAAVHWRLVVQSGPGGRRVAGREGGRRLQGPPTVWLLTDASPGNTTQSLGLLQALGWPYEPKALYFTPRIRLHKYLRGIFGATRLGMDTQRSAALTPPWPDVVVATGWRSAHVTRWIRKQSGGCTRLVQLGRAGGHAADWYDAVVSCTYFRLPPHPRRVEIDMPLTQITPERLAQAAERWRGLFAGVPRPCIALLVGGSSNVYRFNAEIAQCLGESVRTWAQKQGGSVFATTSRRTGPQATEALRRALGEACYVHEWRPGQPDNPYLGFLAAADVLVVTGDSESMLAEAVTTGKPVYIYPLPVKPLTLSERLREWMVARAQQPRLTPDGTVRPQRGVSYLCARLIERGMVLPSNDPNTLHQTLIQHGLARFFGDPLALAPRPPQQALEDVARRVRALVGLG